MEFHVEVRVVPRAGILDPQGKAVGGALTSLGFENTSKVRVGRLITMSIEASTADEAQERVDGMCRQLLANPVVEDYDVRIVEAAGSAR